LAARQRIGAVHPRTSRARLVSSSGLHALAYNLGNFLRTLATPEPIKDWSLTDQDRREGGEPRSLRRISDGRGRHPTADVPRDFAFLRLDFGDSPA
jgi:hypothetical protein